MATINRASRFYRDIDLSFAKNPFTGDIYTKTNEEAVKASVKNLVLTRFYERPFNPSLGSPVTSLLFEPFTPGTKSTLENVITQLLRNYEPRCRLTDVSVVPKEDENSLDVTIQFTITNVQRPLTVNINLRRTR